MARYRRSCAAPSRSPGRSRGNSMANTQDFTATLVVGGPPGPAGPPGPPGPSGPASPWSSNVDAAGFQLQNAGSIAVGKTTPGYAIDVTGDVNVTGHFYRAGVQ